MSWLWAMIGCDKEPDDTGLIPSEPVWSELGEFEAAGSLSGVWGTGADDVWIVGGDELGCEIWHGGAEGFAEIAEPPPVPLLVWIYGFGPDDVFAVGTGGGAVHWDGAAWSVLETGTTTDLWGVWGSSSEDVWVVGGDPEEGEPLILHYDGATFETIPLDPAENDRLAHALFKVFGIGGRVFAVGQAGLIVEWDGSRFVQMSTGPLANEDFVSLWGTSESDLVAVGGRSAGEVATFDGAAFTTVRPQGVPGLNAVTFADGEVVIAGTGGWVGRLDRSSSELVRETPAQSLDLHAAWHDGAGRTYAVGGRFYEPHVGTAVVRTVENP